MDFAGSGSIIHAESDGKRILIGERPIPLMLLDTSEKGTAIAGGYINASGRLCVLNADELRYEVSIADNGIIDACLLDDIRGWAIAGSYGGNMPWRTEDGGATWSQLPKQLASGSITSPFIDD